MYYSTPFLWPSSTPINKLKKEGGSLDEFAEKEDFEDDDEFGDRGDPDEENYVITKIENIGQFLKPNEEDKINRL